MSNQPHPFTIEQALKAGAQRKLDRTTTREIIAAEGGLEPAQIIGYPERQISTPAWDQILSKFDRAAVGEPLPYIIGRSDFYGRSFEVSPATLIPRPETELIVEKALSFLNAPDTDTAPRVIDIGTGSGCIALTLALEYKDRASFFATDISAEALAICKNNRDILGANVFLTQANLLDPFVKEPQFDLIVANLPYVAEHERPLMDQHVIDFEPHLALFSPEEGLYHIKRLLTQCRPILKSNSMILLEFGFQQGKAIRKFAAQIFPNDSIEIIKDWGEHDRILQIRIK